jgi:TIGR03009 family protein
MRLNIRPSLVLLSLVASFSLADPALAQNGASTRQPARTPPRAPERTAARSDAQPAPDNRTDGSAAPRAGAAAPADAKRLPAATPRNSQPAEIAKNVTPRAPFELSPAQQKLLDQILAKWELQSDKVKRFECNFRRWEYDKAFGNPNDNSKKSEGTGEIRYKSPDCGAFIVNSLSEFDPTRKVESPKSEGLDHWVCDGKAIFEYNTAKKQLIERTLAPQLQGKAIADGPLPFIFGAKAEQLKRRYWMRDVTPKDEIGKNIWLEAIPKFQQDAANFQSATVILNESDFMPSALRLFLPGGASNTDYQFLDSKVNDPLAPIYDFMRPKLSLAMRTNGWKHVVEKEPADDAKNAQPPVGEAPQAKRPTANSQRK